jgi:hypothetical protein
MASEFNFATLSVSRLSPAIVTENQSLGSPNQPLKSIEPWWSGRSEPVSKAAPELLAT